MSQKIHTDVQNWPERVSEVIEKTPEILKDKCQVTEATNQILKELSI
jgi:hypothetical protein